MTYTITPLEDCPDKGETFQQRCAVAPFNVTE